LIAFTYLFAIPELAAVNCLRDFEVSARYPATQYLPLHELSIIASYQFYLIRDYYMSQIKFSQCDLLRFCINIFTLRFPFLSTHTHATVRIQKNTADLVGGVLDRALSLPGAARAGRLRAGVRWFRWREWG